MPAASDSSLEDTTGHIAQIISELPSYRDAALRYARQAAEIRGVWADSVPVSAWVSHWDEAKACGYRHALAIIAVFEMTSREFDTISRDVHKAFAQGSVQIRSLDPKVAKEVKCAMCRVLAKKGGST